MRRATIDDVAREAGVSRQTVSRAINGKPEIKAETRERVLAVVEQLGYRPNRLAQSMITQRTYTLGVEVVDITNPVFAEMVRGAEDMAAEHGYNIFLTHSRDDLATSLQRLTLLVTHGIDGLIALFPHAGDDEIKVFADQFRPLVLINRFVGHPHISAITVDVYRGAVMAVEHLIQEGHTAIGMLANAMGEHNLERRLTAYQETLRHHELLPTSEPIVYAAPTLQGGYEGARELLTSYPHLTAIFGYNDLMSIGALRACRDLGRQVPQDCAIIGFDDIPLASIVTPSLSTIRYDKYALGRQAMLRLLAMIEAPDTSFPPLDLPLELTVRESSCRPAT